MLYLLDTGVLLRLFNRKDPNCGAIRNTLWKLRKAGHQFAGAGKLIDSGDWDTREQQWVLRTAFDHAHCHRCDGETRLVEVELAPALSQ